MTTEPMEPPPLAAPTEQEMHRAFVQSIREDPDFQKAVEGRVLCDEDVLILHHLMRGDE